MNGTVALAVPPINTGLRPKSDVTGAVTIDVKRPSSGGSPISFARANPYGSATNAAITPPSASPARSCQPYPVALRGRAGRRGASNIHDTLEGRAEFRHLISRADRDPHVSG